MCTEDNAFRARVEALRATLPRCFAKLDCPIDWAEITSVDGVPCYRVAARFDPQSDVAYCDEHATLACEQLPWATAIRELGW